MSRRIDFNSKKVSEAFRTGNRARKKESVQDAIEGVDIQITKNTCTETVEKLAKSGRFDNIGINNLLVHVISGTAAEIGGFDEVELFTAMQGHGFWVETTLWTEVISDTGWFPDICIALGATASGGNGDGEPGGICYTWYLFSNKRTPGEPVAWHRITPYSRWIIHDSFIDIIKDIVIRARRENIPVAVGEAFRAGNCARKKETAQDTVDSVDNIQAQIDLFKKQTDKELEIRNGRPYFNGPLNLEGCTGLTSLPDGLKVEGYLDLTGCTGLTGLPDGLKVGGSLCLDNCTGLTGLPFDTVVQGYWIIHRGILRPFFEKLRIPIDRYGNTMGSDWRKWQRAHGYLTEAFRAGNRARKKETVQDTVQSVDNLQAQINLFEEQTGEKLKIKNGRPYYRGDLELTGCEDLTSLPQGLLVKGDLMLVDCIGLTSLPSGLTVEKWLVLDGCTIISLPSGLTVGDSLQILETDFVSLPADLTFTNPGGFIVGIPESLVPFIKKLNFESYDNDSHSITTEEWMSKRHLVSQMDEAFRAGNKARKKESAQDTVNIIDAVQAQINLFKEQTGIELEIRDGRPYCNDGISLDHNDRLTAIPVNLVVMGDATFRYCKNLKICPAGLTVKGDLNFAGCKNLAEIPANLNVDGALFLNDCASLKSLPDGMTVGDGLSLWGCLGLTVLPRRLTVGGSLSLRKCCNLKSLPSDLTVNGKAIQSIPDNLHPFIKKLGIKGVFKIDASEWMAKRHLADQVTEAFKAGNRARKKESVQDAVGIFDDLLITPDRVRDYIGTDIRSVEKMCTNGSWRELINRLLSEVFEKPHSNVDTYTKHENGVSISTYYYTGRESHIMVSGNNGYVMRLRVDGEGHPDKFTVGITFYEKGVRCLRGRGGENEYETVLERDNWRRGDGYKFNDEGLLMFCQFLSTGIVPAGFAVEDVVLDEAFKAGNRARKKEAIQDAVESVDNIQAQIDLFKKQTGKELEIKDGRPYFDGNLFLKGCTGLTDLPVGLEVNGYLSLDNCTGLTGLPAGLKVRGTLYLQGCTGLTSLPGDLEVGDLNLEGCTGLTSLPAGLKVGRHLWLKYCTGLTSLPGDLEVGGALNLEGCTGLTSLPDRLKIRGELVLIGCTGLTSLPAGLKVRGRLFLTGCTGLTSLPDNLEVGGYLDLNGCTGLTGLPFDTVILGAWIIHKGILTPFFRKLGIPVDRYGNTMGSDWHKWQKTHGYLTEAFRAGNRARKKEAMQDAAAVIDSVNLSFMDTIGEIESFLCRRGEQEDRVMTAEADAIDSGKWFDWRGRTEDYQALVIEVENIDNDTCNVYVYVDAVGIPAIFDATCQHRLDCSCTRSLSNRAVLGNVLGIFDRLAGPAGEDELPDDLRDNEENWEIYKNLIRKHADFLQPFLCRQDLDRLIVDGVINEAFRAGNRARKKESVQDTVESADRSVTFDEALSEIERLIHRIGSKYKRNLHNNLYSKQRPEAQAEIFHIHPFSSNELTDNDVSRDGFYPGGWSEKVSHSYDAVVDLAYFPELDRTFVLMCTNVCTVDPNNIRRMSVFNNAGSYSEYYMGNYTDKDSLRDIDDYDLMGSEFFYPVDTVSDLGKILEIVTYMLTDKRWLACMALFTVCRPFSSQYTRGLLPGAICPYIRKDLRISPEALHSAVNGALWNELLVRSNGLCGAIVDGRFTYKEILSMFEPDEYRSESGQPKVLLW